MISNEQFLKLLQQSGVQFYTGIPDSLLKHFCACVNDLVEPENHVIAANEGSAVALAAGNHLATGRIPLVYMQNSGLGNSINPILSLADPEVYSIPMLLMIGWRGEPGLHDEPQHIKQGRILTGLLESMEIPWMAIGPGTYEYPGVLKKLIHIATSGQRPVALVVKKDTFMPYVTRDIDSEAKEMMTREEALKILIDAFDDSDIVVSTTGMSSREIFEIRAKRKQGHHRDFLTVGSMGHCSHIALGIAKEKYERKVYCIDGDGAVIMHMGSLSIIGNHASSNFKHIVINNGAHDSVGGQSTVGLCINIATIAKACGYKDSRQVNKKKELVHSLKWLKDSNGPLLMEVRVKKGARKDLGRPTRTPIKNKVDFMTNILR